MGELRAMGMGGDTKTVWDPDNEDEVAAARNTFNELTEKGFLAYAVKTNGEKGTVITEFAPEAARIIMAPPISGG